jgi:hypothetical protein
MAESLQGLSYMKRRLRIVLNDERRCDDGIPLSDANDINRP